MPQKTGPNLGISYGWDDAESGWGQPTNESLVLLDTVSQLSVLSMTTQTPPASPNEGDRYIVPAGATDAWAGHTNDIAVYLDDAWIFLPAKKGWFARLLADGSRIWFDGSAWVDDGQGGGGGDGIPEAPMDGKQYGRQSGTWTEITGGDPPPAPIETESVWRGPGFGVVTTANSGAAHLGLRKTGVVAFYGTSVFSGANSDYADMETGIDDIPALSDIIAVYGSNDFSAISTDAEGCTVYALALRADHSVVAWGNKHLPANYAITPPAVTDAVGAAAGAYAYGIVHEDGTVSTYLVNSESTATWHEPPSGLSGVQGLVALNKCFLALKTDGSLVAWGDSSDSAAASFLDIPSGIGPVARISAINHYSAQYGVVLILQDGTAIAYGGQLSSNTILSTLSGVKDAVDFGGAATLWVDTSGVLHAEDPSIVLPALGMDPSSYPISDAVVLQTLSTNPASMGLGMAVLRANADVHVYSSAETGEFPISGGYHVPGANIVREVPEPVYEAPDSGGTYARKNKTWMRIDTLYASAATFDAATGILQLIAKDGSVLSSMNVGSPLPPISHTQQGAPGAGKIFPAGQRMLTPAGQLLNGAGTPSTSPTKPVQAALLLGSYSFDPQFFSYQDGTTAVVGGSSYPLATGYPAGLKDIAMFAAVDGYHPGAAVDIFGTLHVWNNDVPSYYYPWQFPAGFDYSNVAAVAASQTCLLVLRKTGRVDLVPGLGTTHTPLTDDWKGIVAVAAAGYMFMALRSDGKVLVGGSSSNLVQEMIDDIPTDVRFKSIAMTPQIAFGVTTAGEVRAWGDLSYDTTYHIATIPTGLPEVLSISVDSNTAVVILKDSTVTSWGYYGYFPQTWAAGAKVFYPYRDPLIAADYNPETGQLSLTDTQGAVSSQMLPPRTRVTRGLARQGNTLTYGNVTSAGEDQKTIDLGDLSVTNIDKFEPNSPNELALDPVVVGSANPASASPRSGAVIAGGAAILNGATEFTVFVRLKTKATSSPPTNTMFDIGQSGSGYGAVYFSYSILSGMVNPYLFINGSAVSFSPGGIVADPGNDVWLNAFARGKSATKLAIDFLGVHAEKQITQTFTDPGTANSYIGIGTRHDDNSSFRSACQYGRVAVYNRYLTDSEIAALDAGAEPDTISGLVGFWGRTPPGATAMKSQVSGVPDAPPTATGAMVDGTDIRPGAAVIVGPAPTGDFAGQAGKYARLGSGSWVFSTPARGWMVRLKGTDLYYEHTGGKWQLLGGGGDAGGKVATVASASGVLDLSALPDGTDTVVVELSENITAITLPSGEAGKRADLLIQFINTEDNYTVAGWPSVAVEGGGEVPAVSGGDGVMTQFALTNLDNQGWFMYASNGRVVTLDADPTTDEIADGTFGVFHNSTSGDTKLWANVGGTLKSVALT